MSKPPISDPAETLAAIGPIARSSVVDAVADRLRGEILAGRLAPGSRLPSERELSLALGVNRLTLRASLARLEALGLITTRHGAGTVVSTWQERASLDALATLAGSIKPGEASWRVLMVSMLEVRRVLASEAVGLAAARHTEDDIAMLERVAAEQPARIHDPLAFARGEIAFERVVIRATGNVGLELILNSFARVPEEQPALVGILYDRCDEALALYPFTIGLIRGGDAAVARDTMRRALELVDDEWQARHFPKGSPVAAAESKAGFAPDLQASVARAPRTSRKKTTR